MTYHPKRQEENTERGLDDWLMTYADMITLLLCFFAVFLSVSAPKQEQFKQARDKVLETFSKEIPVGSDGDKNKKQLDSIYDSMPAIIDRFGSEPLRIEEVVDGDDEKHKSKKEKPDGDRLLTIEMPSAAFFGSGSATLSDEGKTLLKEILETEIKKQDLEGYIITIEGHTDDVPINTYQFPSNWELSTARAASVVRYFIEEGLAPQKLRASGYADSFPKIANRGFNGQSIPENQAQNRRVIIKLEKLIKDNQ
jgi:chemotaxis protein MotB